MTQLSARRLVSVAAVAMARNAMQEKEVHQAWLEVKGQINSWCLPEVDDETLVPVHGMKEQSMGAIPDPEPAGA